jgi:hypothetical protein
MKVHWSNPWSKVLQYTSYTKNPEEPARLGLGSRIRGGDVPDVAAGATG